LTKKIYPHFSLSFQLVFLSISMGGGVGRGLGRFKRDTRILMLGLGYFNTLISFSHPTFFLDAAGKTRTFSFYKISISKFQARQP